MKKTVMLTVTEKCNLSCIYCYEQNKSLKTMTYDTAVRILDDELDADDEYDECEVQFFGGEPFLEFDLIKSVCDYIWSRDWNKKIKCFTTTNGTLVHGKIKQWLFDNRNRFTCGLSLDGLPEAHNINRNNSFDKIDYQFFIDNWENQYVKMTISPETLPMLAEGVIYLHNLGFEIDNNLAYGVDWTDEKYLKVLEEQLKLLADYYIDNVSLKPCRMLNLHLENIASPVKMPRWCGAGKGLRSYDVEGKVYPCQMFTPLSNSNVNYDDIMKIKFDSDTTIDTNCEECPIYNVCPTCYGHNYSATGSISSRDKSLCKLTQISTRAIAYLWFNKLNKYKIEELNITKEKVVLLIEAIEIIANWE
jgi:uncharacterized protein